MPPERTERCADARAEVLAAATRLFARHGYSGTGMRQIAAEAGVALSMINYHFGSKQALLEEIVDRFHARYVAAIRQAVEREGTLEEKLRSFVHAAVGVARAAPDDMRIAFTELPEEVPDIATFKAQRIKRVIEVMATHIVPHLRREDVPALHFLGPAMSSAVFSHFLVRPVLARVFADLPDDDEFYAEYADRIASFLLYGLAGRPAAS